MSERFNKYFRRSEFLCRGFLVGICNCGCDTVDKLTFEYLMASRIFFDKPLIITSACRCLIYNRHIGSDDSSQHLKFRAVDHYIVGVSAEDLYKFYSSKFGTKYGLGLYNDFVHIDTRSDGPSRWDDRTPN